MVGLFLYHISNYVKSFRSIPPIILYMFVVTVNYSYMPNPILDSYSFTSLALFFVMGWIVVTVFHMEEEGQQQITNLHSKSVRKYYFSLFLLCVLVGCVLSAFAVAYPILINGFGVSVYFVHIAMGVMAHVSLSVLAISLSAYFTRAFVKNRANTLWGVIAILILSVVVAALKEKIIHISGLIWILPPVYLSLEMMNVDDGLQIIPGAFWWKFGWIAIYSIILICVFLILVKNKQTD